MVEAAILTFRWLGLRPTHPTHPTHPSQRYGFCLRRFFMVNLPHGREIQGSLGVQSLLLRSILRLVRLNDLSVVGQVGRHGAPQPECGKVRGVFTLKLSSKRQ